MATMSTGLRDNLLDTGSMKGALDGGYIHIYGFAGTTSIPGPDEAVDTATAYNLLATIKENSTATPAGLNFAASASGGVLQKASAETWDNSDTTNAAGTAKFFVHVGSDAAEADGDLAASTTLPRIVGTVETAGADLNLSSTTFTAGQTQSITYYSVSVG